MQDNCVQTADTATPDDDVPLLAARPKQAGWPNNGARHRERPSHINRTLVYPNRKTNHRSAETHELHRKACPTESEVSSEKSIHRKCDVIQARRVFDATHLTTPTLDAPGPCKGNCIRNPRNIRLPDVHRTTKGHERHKTQPRSTHPPEMVSHRGRCANLPPAGWGGSTCA